MVAYMAVIASLGGAASPIGQAFDPWRQSARYDLEYRVEVDSLAAGGRKPVHLWLPTPGDTVYQTVRSVQIEAPWPYRKTGDWHGNRFVYIEIARAADARGKAVVMRFRVERQPHQGLPKGPAQAGAADDPKRYLGPQSRIPLDGKIKALADKTGRGLRSDDARIRAFYEHVVSGMTYSKRGTGWGRGDAIWACNAGYGNCTDFHSLFIGMARSQGIAARFVMGFAIPADKQSGGIGGYHCWGEAFDPERGWIAIDASQAKQSGRLDRFFGTLPSDRVEFTVGRDLILDPPQKGPPLNFFIYPYAEIDGRPAGKIPWRVTFRRLWPRSGSRVPGQDQEGSDHRSGQPADR